MLLTDPADVTLFIRAKDVVKRKSSKKLLHMMMLLLEIRKRECCPNCGSEEFYHQASVSEIHAIYSDGHLELESADRDWDNSTCFECDYED